MIVPLIVLAVGALAAGYFNFPNEQLGRFLGHSPSLVYAHDVAEHHGVAVDAAVLGQPEVAAARESEGEHTSHTTLMVISGLVSLAGIGLAYQLHLKDRPAGEALPRRFPAVDSLLQHKYWVDEIYDALFVQPLWRLGQLFYAIDRIVIDGLVWLVGFVPQLSGFTLKLTTQRGHLQGYAGAMALGIVVILLFVFW
jgi:NADH-quinone oxidoreductase subunit L